MDEVESNLVVRCVVSLVLLRVRVTPFSQRQRVPLALKEAKSDESRCSFRDRTSRMQ